MKFKLKDFNNDAKFNVSALPQRDAFLYSDGADVEKRIYEVLVQATDRTCFSRELASQIIDWPSEYHFSSLRHNLLRHVTFTSSDNVLELGCGCGAITRQLGESGANVTAVEGNFDRAKCAAARCEDLNNVEVFCSNFQDIAFQKQYDYVTMIGVFEYCSMYFKGDDPVPQCLDIVKSALKPGGKLILAIENRLGLKYFAGIEEDHVGIPYYGIQDFYKPNTVATYGKVELSNLLSDNGFCSIEYQYPFPDYKIPKVVFMESAFKNPLFRPAEIIRQLNSRAYSKKTTHQFSENLVWPVLEANKLIPDFSNSFLVFAGTENEKPATSNILAIYYTVDRAAEYNVRTEFVEDGAENILVRKAPIIEKPGADQVIIHQCIEDCYYPGRHLDAEIRKVIYEDDLDGYIKKIQQWIEFVISDGIKSANSEDIYSSLLLPEFIDCIPINLITSPEGLVYIDREWRFMADFSLTTLLLRYLDRESNAAFINKHIRGQERPCGRLLHYLGIPFNDRIYMDYRRVNDIISKLVYLEKAPDFSRQEDISVMKKIDSYFHLLIQKISNWFCLSARG
ncbi:class I SAM-dependent methyltransferase [Pelobacter propionicus]|uniref:Methyltransferase type 12 n=1 Tax=Pelobacter propionicus (strain DSM 2379 / NBRC 103807 / OttBd1) TaxID=338966 RepID=A1AQU4_PELPD|nr:class I SAM-dependent methyltransferase [Pelobacter propionicus]ABK99714.1 Methyltransferase type 12 [Pelobacter propionicus DSM 2379]